VAVSQDVPDGWWNQHTHWHALFNLDFGALLFQFLLDAIGLFLGDAGFHRFGCAFDEVLRLLQPRLVSSRTTLMTWIFLSPALARTTSNAVFLRPARSRRCAAARRRRRRRRRHAKTVLQGFHVVVQFQDVIPSIILMNSSFDSFVAVAPAWFLLRFPLMAIKVPTT